MLNKKEANHKIDGVESWIHCILFDKENPTVKK